MTAVSILWVSEFFNSLSLAVGDHSLAFSVPADAVAGAVTARFRFEAVAGGLAPRGLAVDGEVEGPSPEAYRHHPVQVCFP